MQLSFVKDGNRSITRYVGNVPSELPFNEAELDAFIEYMLDNYDNNVEYVIKEASPYDKVIIASPLIPDEPGILYLPLRNTSTIKPSPIMWNYLLSLIS
jgi:hypothetical protein